MQKMSPISTFEIALDIRAGRIPVRWTVRDSHRPEERDSSGRVIWKSEVERVFWPQVELNKWGEAVVAEIEGPLDLRAHLFKAVNTNWSEKAVLAFLDRAGAWRILPAAREEEWAKGTYANVEFLHRYRTAVQILAVTVKELREEAEYWYRLLQCLGDPAKLKKAFRPPPGGEARISDVIMFGLDVASHTGPQVCGHCMTRFASARKKKYCRPDCGHAVAVRNYKRKLALAKKGQRVGAEAHTSDS
jgi:hypothetical protein